MEVFHEDILETFVFCFLASLGVIQIMIGVRGWHGLSACGGRAHKNVTNAMGVALIILAYAWYFSDPLHRNVRNIEGFMSLVCLGLGVAAAVAAAALTASASGALRRVFRRRAALSEAAEDPKRIPLEDGAALLYPSWGKRGENLVVIAEPGRAGERMSSLLYSSLPAGRGLLSLHLDPDGDPELTRESGEGGLLDALARLSEEEDLDLEGESFLGLGWASNLLLRSQERLRLEMNPRETVLLAPIVSDPVQGYVGDSLLSNTPSDIIGGIALERPWRGDILRYLLRLWWPVFLLCAAGGTLVTLAFDVRWKYISGPAAGLALSLWLAYLLAARKGRLPSAGSREAGIADAVFLRLPAGSGGRVKAVIVSGGSGPLVSTNEGLSGLPPDCVTEFWDQDLRGKFLLNEGTFSRLYDLIWEKERG